MSFPVDELDPKDSQEVVDVAAPFAALLADIASHSVAVSVLEGGYDANPSALLSGAATVAGTTITQRITGGRPGTTYLIRFRAVNAAGLAYVREARLPVRGAGG
jgi:hypothetical protein